MTCIATGSTPQTRCGPVPSPRWLGLDALWPVAWFLIGIALRGPLVARIEGVLDHDQSIVGLMSLDIASGVRWPIFFDGQRYMGAVEAYVAAVFVLLLGHSPAIVALAPLLFFGLFAAGQYLLWSRWTDRVTGHLAALLTVCGGPMLTIWSIVPRGGYIEFLAWALPVLGLYRKFTRPGAPSLSRRAQAAWGFLFAFGYFLNPLSLIIYVAMAIDWTLGRHGADLRRERRLNGGWIDSRRVYAIWSGMAAGLVLALSVCCHVKFHRGGGKSPFVFFFDALPTPIGTALGALGIAALIGLTAWWTGAARRIAVQAATHTAFGFGAMLALTPFLVHNLRVSLGLTPFAHSLPIWVRGPWDVGVNLRDGFSALGPLLGCDPEGPASVLIGQGIDLPLHVWPVLARGLSFGSPLMIAIVLGLIAGLAWSDRASWRRFWTLRGEEATAPTVLALLVLAVAATLYVLQATSPNASSVRYLIPVWIVLPGLLARALRSLRRPYRAIAALALVVPWGLAQVNLWAEIDRPASLGPLARELDRRGIKGIVAETPVALMVANLSHGRVGAMEYRSRWPRLNDRYRRRFVVGEPVACVVDLQLTWHPGEDESGSLLTNLSQGLNELASRHPKKVRRAWRIDHFEVWEVDLPISEILPDDAPPLPPRRDSAKLAGLTRLDPASKGAEPTCPPRPLPPANRRSAGASSAAPASRDVD